MSFCGIVYCTLVISLPSIAHSALIEFPRNRIVLEHESPETIDMTCKSDSHYNLKWFIAKSHDSERIALYNGYYLNPIAKSYCTVIMDEPGKYNLRLKNTAEAAQTYICLEPGTLVEASADLIWLGDPTCNDSSTDDLVNLTCSVEFRGNWAPTMEWKEHSSYGERVLSVGINTDKVLNQSVTSTLVMAAQRSSKNYTCTTKFNISGKPIHTSATNVPDCNLSWTTSVLYKVQDDFLPDRHHNETQTNGFQNESSQTLIIAVVSTVALVGVAATVTTIVYLFVHKDSTGGQNENGNIKRGSRTTLVLIPKPGQSSQTEEEAKKDNEVPNGTSSQAA